MAFSISEISVEDMPISLKSGSARRRVKIIVRGTSAATTDTLNLASYVSGLAGIEGFLFQSINGAVAGTTNTWSGTTITFASHTGSGAQVLEVMGYMT